jgi:hypothetical protein
MARSALPITPGYAFDNPPDLRSLAERVRLSAAALEGFFAIMERWRVDADAAAALLGGVPRATFYKLKKSPTIRTQEVLTRVGYIVGIYKTLHILLRSEHADARMTNPNREWMFGGRTPLAYAIHGGIPALGRSLLDATRDGNLASDLSGE